LKRRAILGSPSGAEKSRELSESFNRAPLARNRGVAAPRQSAAGDSFRIWRRSAETPLREDGSAALTEALPRAPFSACCLAGGEV
jgi:hypothetical protein